MTAAGVRVDKLCREKAKTSRWTAAGTYNLGGA